MDHDEAALMTALAGLPARIERFILDSSATRHDGQMLGRDLVILGGALTRHARVRAATWGHTYLEPHRWHVRTAENESENEDEAVGSAVCGAWLVATLPAPRNWDFAACPSCLATLA